MEEICRSLQHEQESLELLLFRLVVTRLLLDASELRHVARAAGEVERARYRTREADLFRAAAVADVSLPHHTDRVPTLRALAAASDDPWTSILRDHHEAMAALVAEIEVTAHQNARLALLARERLNASVGKRSNHGAPHPARDDAEADLTRLVTEAALETVLGGASRLRMPSLLSFLR